MGEAVGARPVRDRTLALGLGAIAVLAFAVRLVYILHWRDGLPVGGDSLYYHEGANLLAHGHGFIDPFQFLDAGRAVEAADHPPAYLVYLALISRIGLEGPTAHMVASAALGVLTVVLIGLVARELAGRRAALIAASLAALYPNLWAYDGALESETVAQLAVALTVLAAYAWWRAPSRRLAIALGVAIALGALARAEMILLAILVVVPLVVLRAELARRDRVRHLAVVLLAVAVGIAPWCAYNLARFSEPTLLSTGLGPALQSSACDTAYEGPLIGYWDRTCVLDAINRSGLAEDADRSELDKAQRAAAYTYIRGHLGRLPVVVLARVGRVAGVFHLRQQTQLESFVGGREEWVVWSGWWSFFALALLSVGGGVVLHRRRIPVFPLAACFVLVVMTTAVFFGLLRYRAIAEVPLVVLAAVALDAAVATVRRSHSASMATT